MNVRIEVTAERGTVREAEQPRDEVRVEVYVEGERADVQLPEPPPLSMAAREAWVEHLNVDVTGPVLREATACASIMAVRVAEALSLTPVEAEVVT